MKKTTLLILDRLSKVEKWAKNFVKFLGGCALICVSAFVFGVTTAACVKLFSLGWDLINLI